MARALSKPKASKPRASKPKTSKSKTSKPKASESKTTTTKAKSAGTKAPSAKTQPKPAKAALKSAKPKLESASLKRKSAAGETTSAKRAPGKTATGKTAVGKTATGKAATGKAATGKAATGKRTAGKVAARKSAARKSTASKSAARKPAARKPATRKSVARASGASASKATRKAGNKATTAPASKASRKATRTTAKAAPRKAAKKTVKTATKTTAKTTAKATAKTTTGKADKTAAKTTTKTTAKKAAKTTANAKAKSGVKATAGRSSASVVKPVVKRTVKRTAKRTAKRTGAPARAPRAVNPFLRVWPTGPGDLPPFDAISTGHYAKAFRAAMAAHRAEVEAILANSAPPTFDNTVGALERAGRLLDQVSSVFWNLVGSNADAAMQALERAIAPELAQHSAAITLDPRLFARVDALWETRDALGLDAQEARVLERTHSGLVRGGARLEPAAKARVAQIVERLASLTATFMQNVMKDEQDWRLLLDESDLDGLPETMRAAAKRAAQDAGRPDKWAITLARSSVEGFLTFSARRDLRERAFAAWIARGAHEGENDNAPVLAEVVALRGEYARLLGFPDYARFNLDDAMAGTPEAVDDLLRRVWRPALARAAEERDALLEQARAMGDDVAIEAWDWRYYAEKLRAARYDFDQGELRPYLSLDAMIEAAFATARRLFGLSFTEIADAPRYHRDVRVWSVADADGAPVGMFLGDYFARPGKRSGAWMSSFRTQNKLDGEVRPIIVNVMNFARGGEGEPTLLSFDDARTLFHEFGHALHGLLSNVTYPSIAGTAVARDFVELPSQLYEHWLETPEILGAYARHVETGEALPQALIDKLKAARDFNQGFATVEYTASALVDMALYREPDPANLDIRDFEARALERIGMPREIVMRHRLPHFMHIVSGYAAGYYSYMWSEVMDADAFEAFRETGDVFDPATAARLREFIYSAGDSRDPAESWRLFRGRAPSVEGLLKKRGFAA